MVAWTRWSRSGRGAEAREEWRCVAGDRPRLRKMGLRKMGLRKMEVRTTGPE
jgi:hypothetical protein